VVGLAAAPSALAGYWKVQTTNWPGQVGPGYTWYDDNGVNTGRQISYDTWIQLRNEYVAAGYEGVGQPIPSDIPASDAQAGTSIWDELAATSGVQDPGLLNGGVTTVSKTGFLDMLTGEGLWPTFAAFPLQSFLAVAATAYVGWHVGSWIAGLLGFSGGATYNASTGCTGTCHVDESATGFVLSYGGLNLCDDHQLTDAQIGTLNTATECTGPVGGCGSCHFGNVTDAVIPEDMMVAEFSATGFGYSDWNDTITNAPALANGGCERFHLADDFDSNNVKVGSNWAVACPLEVTSLPGPGQNTSSPLAETTSQGTLPAPSEDQVKQGATDCLTASFPPADTYATAAETTCKKVNDYTCAQPNSPCSGFPTGTGSQTVTLPQITSGETFDQYRDAAKAAGITGPITDVVLTDTEADPSVPPNDVTATVPTAGSQVDPSTAVQVDTNPADNTGTGTGTGTGGPVGPVPPGITPPTGATPCNVFPFGVPCWTATQLAAFNASPVAPTFDMNLPFTSCGSAGATCGIHANLGSVFGVDTSSVMSYIRPILLAVSLIGIVWWIAGFALGGSTGGGGGNEGED